MLQKIEKWRVQELSLVLNRLAHLLREGGSCEWANVFSHFLVESQKIILKKEFDLELLQRLVKNIKNCFLGVSSLRNLILWHEDSSEGMDINQDFYQTRNRLLIILKDFESRTIEYLN